MCTLFQSLSNSDPGDSKQAHSRPQVQASGRRRMLKAVAMTRNLSEVHSSEIGAEGRQNSHLAGRLFFAASI